MQAWGGVRLFCPDTSRTLFSEVAMLMSVGLYSQLLSGAGTSIIRLASAYPKIKLEHPLQDRSTVPRGSRLTRLRSQTFIQPFASSRR